MKCHLYECQNVQNTNNDFRASQVISSHKQRLWLQDRRWKTGSGWYNVRPYRTAHGTGSANRPVGHYSMKEINRVETVWFLHRSITCVMNIWIELQKFSLIPLRWAFVYCPVIFEYKPIIRDSLYWSTVQHCNSVSNVQILHWLAGVFISWSQKWKSCLKSWQWS